MTIICFHSIITLYYSSLRHSQCIEMMLTTKLHFKLARPLTFWLEWITICCLLILNTLTLRLSAILDLYHLLIFLVCYRGKFLWLHGVVVKLVAEFIYLFVILTICTTMLTHICVYGHSDYYTILTRGLRLVDMAEIWYDHRLYTVQLASLISSNIIGHHWWATCKDWI